MTEVIELQVRKWLHPPTRGGRWILCGEMDGKRVVSEIMTERGTPRRFWTAGGAVAWLEEQCRDPEYDPEDAVDYEVHVSDSEVVAVHAPARGADSG